MKKKTAFTVLCISALMTLCSCAEKKNTESSEFSFNGSAQVPSVDFSEKNSSPAEESSEQNSEHSSEQSSKQSSEQSSQQNSAAVSLPDGVTKAAHGKLRYSTSVLSLSVTFSDEFCILNNDYRPDNGIYLQNSDGTATLMLEAVGDNTLTYRNMTAYLRKQYPEARVYATDRKDVVCKMNSVDRSGNKICILEKIRVKTGGYNSAVICCRPEEKEKYEGVLDDVTFS